MMTDKNAIICENLSFSYFENGDSVLENVSLEIPAGKMTVIMGSSGCGKSTMASLMCGLLPENGGFLTGGSLKLFGRDVQEMKPAARTPLVSMMFQNPDLQFCMSTLREELYFCMENTCVERELMAEKAINAARVIGTEHLLDRKLFTLSGGEKQRAILTCIHLLDAKCIILDEPFANLDPDSSKELIRLFDRLCHETGKTIVAIDHMSDHWLGTADRFVLLGKGGKVLYQAESPEQLREARPIFKEQGIAYPGIWRETASGQRKEVTDITAGNAGHGVYFHKLTVPREPVRIRRDFLGRKKNPAAGIGELSEKETLLYQAEAYIPEGKITAILGKSGCGKTSLLMTLLFQRAYGGNITIRSEDGDQEMIRIRKKVGFSKVGMAFQNPSNQFITQNVTAEVSDGLGRRFPEDTKEQTREKALELLDTCGLKAYREFSPYMLSQGQQRRLAVLAVLADGQKLLLLDEPTYGQDYRSARALMDQVRKRVMEEGLTVIMTTHDVGLCNAYADVRYRIEDRNFVLLKDVPSGNEDKGWKNGCGEVTA